MVYHRILNIVPYGIQYDLVVDSPYIYWYAYTYVAAANLLQSCPTVCDSISSSAPGSTVSEILQVILECVAISFSNA